MMHLLLLTSLAAAADLHVSATVPTEVWLEGQPAAKLYRSGSLTISLGDEGDIVRVKVFVEGTPEELELRHPGAGGTTFLTVGKHGVSVPNGVLPAPPASGPVPVTLEVKGHAALRVQVDDRRQRLDPGAQLELGLEPGEHRLVVSSADGLVRWASGTLEISGAASSTPTVVQLADGKLPEVHGDGGAYWPDQG